jgi:hypothetical protein
MKPACCLLPAVWLAALAVAACGSPTLTPPDSPFLFRDSFTQDLSLWDVFEEPGAISEIVDGHLRLTVSEPSSVAFTLAALNVADFDLTVQTVHLTGGAANTYGVIFRYIDSGNFYRFDISGDGLWGVSRRQGDQWISIVELTASPNIHTAPPAANALRLVARADEFVFYANDLEVGRIRDNNLPVGRIGLFASTFEEAPIQVSFDDLVVVAP